MDEPVRSTWYVSRRVQAPAVAVAHALDRMLSDGPVAVDTGGAVLTVRPVDTTAAARGHLSLRAVIPGPFTRRVAVDLEVEAWSAGTCELGLRPVGRRVPRDADRYGEAAGFVLERVKEQVAGALAARAAEEDREALRRAS